MEMFAIVMPTLSESSVTLIFRFASITSMLTIMAMSATSYRQIVLGLHVHGALQGSLENGRRGRDHDRDEPDRCAHHHAPGAVVTGGRQDEDFSSDDKTEQ